MMNPLRARPEGTGRRLEGARRAARAVALLLGLAGPLAPCVASAQAAPTQGSSSASLPLPDAHSPLEEEALSLFSQGLAVSARTAAERVLRADPDSIAGHYVLGRVLFEAEGSLARAMRHLGRARELYEQRELPRSGGGPFHEELLFSLARLAGQMELYPYQLDLLGYHDHLYEPDMIAERCWPLLKLGRIDEARRFAQVAVGSPNPWQRSAGLNALCAIEGEARSRAPYHQACMAALEDARREVAGRTVEGDDEESGGITVDAFNAALGAASALNFTDAESLALEGVRRFEPTAANPWEFLLELRLSSGQSEGAIEAFERMVGWNERQPAALRDQGRAETEALVAMLLLLAGDTERAEAQISRALGRPDRRGLTTDGAEQARGRHALVRRIVERTREEERAEEASWTGRFAQLENFLGALGRGLDHWPDDERIATVMAEGDRLVSSLRPYVSGSVAGASPWLALELVDVLGPSVVSVGLRSARARDADDPAADPFFDALQVEILAHRGDAEAAVALAASTLPRLEGAGWALVRARVAAVAAGAAEDAGMEARANELFATAMELDPGVLRRLGRALPCRITGQGADAEEAASWLARSPRFTDRRRGFELAVTPSPSGGLSACLRTAAGNELRCTEVLSTLPEDAGAEEREMGMPRRLARQVHRELFGLRVSTGRIDLRSLDGSPTGGSALARERLRALMDPPPAASPP